MASTQEERKAFVERLKWACDESPYIPPAGEGRGQVLSERLKVAPEAVSKWFKGVSMPRTSKMRELADLLGVDPAWLHFGEQPKVSNKDRKLHVKANEGAVHLAWGMVALAGGMCGTVPSNDERSELIDFVATIDNVAYPIHVALGREVSVDAWEIRLPNRFREVRTVAVIPVGSGEYRFLDMPWQLVDGAKQAVEGKYVVLVLKKGTKFITPPLDEKGAPTHWPRLITFTEFPLTDAQIESAFK